MKLLINDDQKISSIQEKFSMLFPYLRLEFYSRSHKTGEGSPKQFIKSGNLTIGQCRSGMNNGKVVILPSMTVSKLERVFDEVYGLYVQVFRKSGKIWLQTTLTDAWTLEKQNAEGEALNYNENTH